MRARLLILHAFALLASTAAHAQLPGSPDINLFGDDFVQKLSENGRGRVVTTNGPGAAEKAAEYQHALLFHDGRQLCGELVAVTKDEIVWRRADADGALRIARGEVRRVVLLPDGERAGARPSVKVPATVKLPGGDWLFGNVTSADGESFRIEVGAAASFAVAREQIEWLHFGAEPAPAFGFSGSALSMQGWLPETAAFEVKDGVLTVREAAWIGRAVSPLPRFEVAFELPADGEEGTRLWLQPHGPSTNSYSQGTVQFGFGRKQLSRLLYTEKFEQLSTPLPPEVQAEKGPASYRVFYDGVARKVSVWRNGRQLGDWKFAEQKAEKANAAERVREIRINAICFDQENRGEGGGGLKFHRIRVQPWDGAAPTSGEPIAAGDRLSASDAAAVAGRLEAVTDKELVFSGETKPRQAAMTVQFAGAPAPIANAEALLLLGQQGEVSAADLEVSDGQVRCRTAFAPALELPLSTLQALAFPQQSAGPMPPGDRLVFKNGDELPGTLLSAELGGSLRWQMTGGQQVAFQPGRVAGVRLAPGEKAPAPGGTATVELRSGERLRGEFTALDAQHLQLRHAQLGPLAIPRAQVARAFPNPLIEVHDGARDPAGWLEGSGKWKPARANARAWLYLDGTYLPRRQGNQSNNDDDTPSLQREVGAGLERFEVRGEGTFMSGYGNFGFRIYSEGNVSLQATISPQNAYLTIGGQNGRNVDFREKLPEATTRLALRMFVDARTGRADLFINGMPIMRSAQSASARQIGFKGARTVRFMSYNRGGSPVVFSNLWIGPWSGELPRAGAEPGAVTALVNGDATAGTPQEWRDGKLLLETEIGPLHLPADKVLAVDFGGAPQPERAPARVRLADGSVVNLQTFRWAGRELAGRSALFGELRFPAGVVSELIYDPTPLRPPAVTPAKKLAQKMGGERP